MQNDIERNFKLYTDCLHNQLTDAYITLEILKKFDEVLAEDDYYNTVNHHRLLFRATVFAYTRALKVDLNKVYDKFKLELKNKNPLSIFKYVHYAKTHREKLFSLSNFKNRVHNDEGLIARFKQMTIDEILGDEKSLIQLSDIIERLRIDRDKYLTHNDIRALKKTKILKEYFYKELDRLIFVSHDIVARYIRSFSNEILTLDFSNMLHSDVSFKNIINGKSFEMAKKVSKNSF